MDDLDVQLTSDVQKISDQIVNADLPEELKIQTREMIERLARQAKHGSYANEFETIRHYADWVTHLPWNNSTQDNLDLAHVKAVLDSHHFGLEPLKERFLEYMSIMILNRQREDLKYRAPVLLLVGLVGTGKTTIAISIAEALGRKVIRIPFGGMSSALDLRGQSRTHPEAEPGQLIKGLRRAGTNNPIILLDEIDRVAESARGEIMGVLVELLDPAQNNAFIDHYIDYPFDLSKAMFIATCNNTTHIATAVMDRLEPIVMPSYTDQEKIHIAKEYILPAQLKRAALPDGTITIDEAVWPKLARPLGYDAGIRTLERTIEGMVRKIAKMIVEKKGEKFVIDEGNIKQFLPTY
jgi:ATP-dependent Lon protease